MATLTYDPSTGKFLNGATVQTPAAGDTVAFTDNGGVPYTFTVPADFPSLAEIDITSGDATVVVPGGQTLDAGVIDVNNNSALDGGTLVLGAPGGTASESTVVNTNTFDMENGGHVVVNDSATVNTAAVKFVAGPDTPGAKYGVSIADGATLRFVSLSDSNSALDLSGAPTDTFIDTNTSGEFEMEGYDETSSQLVGVDDRLSGGGIFVDAGGTVGGAGETFDTSLFPFAVTLTSQVRNVASIETNVPTTITGPVVGPAPLAGETNVILQDVAFDGVTLTGNLPALSTGQSLTIKNGLAGTGVVTDQGGIITSTASTTFNGPTFNFTTPVGGATQNLFSAEFATTTFGPISRMQFGFSKTFFDGTGGVIEMNLPATVDDATVQFTANQLILGTSGVLQAFAGATVNINSDINSSGQIQLASGSVVNFNFQSLTAPGVLDFLGKNNGVNFSAPGVDPPTLINFGDSDQIDIGSTIGGDSDFGPNSTAELSGSLLDVLNNAGSVIAAFTLQRTDGFVYKQSDFQVNTDGNGGTLVFTSGVADVACFAAGAHILTSAGELPVERLREGDLVPVRGALRPIVWIGHRRVECRGHPQPEKVWPVRIAAHAFGPGRPHFSLVLSPDHAVLAAPTSASAVGEGDGERAAPDVLIPIRHLINGETIVQVPMDEVTYYHVELSRHEVLLAEGLACESYLDTGNRAAFANAGVTAVHADFTAQLREAEACAPLVVTGPAVLAACHALRERALRERTGRDRRVLALGQ